MDENDKFKERLPVLAEKEIGTFMMVALRELFFHSQANESWKGGHDCAVLMHDNRVGCKHQGKRRAMYANKNK